MDGNDRPADFSQQVGNATEKHSNKTKDRAASLGGSKGVKRKPAMSAKANKQGFKEHAPISPGIKRATTDLNRAPKDRPLIPRSRRTSSSRPDHRSAGVDSERGEMTNVHDQGQEADHKTAGESVPVQAGPGSNVSGPAGHVEEDPALLVFPAQSVNLDKGASPQYQSIMDEIRIKRQQQLEAMRKRAEDERLANIAYVDFSDEESDSEEGDGDQKKISPLRQTALRAWAIIRRNVNEVAMERKNKGSSLNWSFLRQTIKRMTDMEKGRQELYDKYLHHREDWKDGIINKHLLKIVESRRHPKSSDADRSASPSPRKGSNTDTSKRTMAR